MTERKNELAAWAILAVFFLGAVGAYIHDELAIMTVLLKPPRPGTTDCEWEFIGEGGARTCVRLRGAGLP